MLTALLSKFAKSARGAVAVEFAIVSPFIVLLILGAWDAGRLINLKTDLTSLSRSGQQYAISKFRDADAVRNAVLEEASRRGITNVSVAVETTCQCLDGTVPDVCSATNACGEDARVQIFLEVSATKDFNPVAPFPIVSGDSSFTSSSTMRVR